jgi:hypothetical protein
MSASRIPPSSISPTDTGRSGQRAKTVATRLTPEELQEVKKNSGQIRVPLLVTFRASYRAVDRRVVGSSMDDVMAAILCILFRHAGLCSASLVFRLPT